MRYPHKPHGYTFFSTTTTSSSLSIKGFLTSATSGPAFAPALQMQSSLASSPFLRSIRVALSQQQRRTSPAIAGRHMSSLQPQPTQIQLVKNFLPVDLVSLDW